MDSFELQMQFKNHLMGLNSSKQASLDICNFLIRNYVSQEDLYPVILEVLPKLDINKRLNVFQCIYDFLFLIIKDKKLKDNDIIYNYAFLIISDLQKILQFVIPGNIRISEEGNNNAPSSHIRTLSNLPFCFQILTQISELFEWENLSSLKSKYISQDSIDKILTTTELNNFENGILFNDSQYYTENIEATKSSHVDDYINSSPQLQSSENNVEKNENVDNYIPERINQGLADAWKFLMNKRKQSIYESCLIDEFDDPFKCKSLNNIENSTISDDIIFNPKTLSKTPAKVSAVPSSQPEVQQSSTTQSSLSTENILSLSHNLILQRIEADRERQKRGKEISWEIERTSNKVDISEFNFIYETSYEYNPVNDKPLIDEMENLYQLCTFGSKIPTSKNAPSAPKRRFKTLQPSKTLLKSQAQAKAKAKEKLQSQLQSQSQSQPQSHPQSQSQAQKRQSNSEYDKNDLFYNVNKRLHTIPNSNNRNNRNRSYGDYYNNSDNDWYKQHNESHRNNNYYKGKRR